MEKIQVLFIRACKSKNPERRIKRLYVMFFGEITDDSDFHIASILTTICEESRIVKLSKLLSDLHPAKQSRLSRNSDVYWKSVVSLLIGYIRYEHIGKFEGFILPEKYRNY